jgi:hypothetical protein
MFLLMSIASRRYTSAKSRELLGLWVQLKKRAVTPADHTPGCPESAASERANGNDHQHTERGTPARRMNKRHELQPQLHDAQRHGSRG